MRFTRFVSTLLLTALLLPHAPGCTPQPPELPEEEFTSIGSWAEVAKTQTLLTATTYTEIETTITAAIDETKKEIAALKTDIAASEAKNAANLQEIQNLNSRIAARQAQLEHDKSVGTAGAVATGAGAVLCGIFTFGICTVALGGAAVASAAYAAKADTLLDQLVAEKKLLTDKRYQLEAELVAYQARKKGLESRLSQLETAEQDILALLAESSVAVVGPDLLASWPNVATQARRLRLLEQLLVNLEGQETILSEILTLSKAVGTNIAALLVETQALKVKADQVVAIRREALFEFILVLTSGNPLIPASEYLLEALAARSKMALELLESPVADFALFLVDYTNLPSELAAGARQQLVVDITSAIVNASPDADWSHLDDAGLDLEAYADKLDELFGTAASFEGGSPSPADAADPDATPPATNGADSCVGACGQQTSSGCFCDGECDAYGDCCTDFAAVCVNAVEPGANPTGGSCVGSCGDLSPDGCFCDLECTLNDDCCSDYGTTCAEEP